MAWRWTAYEYILEGKIGLKSDIWSFGVLFWEILSLGEIVPYVDHVCLDEGFKENLENGYRLQCPKKIKDVTNWFPYPPEEMFENISNSCFHLEPEKRSTFEKIGEIIATNFSQEELQHYSTVYDEWDDTPLSQRLNNQDEPI